MMVMTTGNIPHRYLASPLLQWRKSPLFCGFKFYVGPGRCLGWIWLRFAESRPHLLLTAQTQVSIVC
jgi:hypothetical protein